MHYERKSLSDILRNGSAARLSQVWDATQAAGDFAAAPPGEYISHVHRGELFTSKSAGTPGYKITFRVIEGECVGRLFWLDLWLTEAALPMTKRDLSKLGINSPEQLETPIPVGRIRCRVKIARRRSDQGDEYNAVKSFEVVGIDEAQVDPFAPEGGPSQ